MLCMVMLMLIHLDAYMYEAINLFHVESTEQCTTPFAEDVTCQEEDMCFPVWDDLSYSRASSRINWLGMAACILPLALLFSFVCLLKDRYRGDFSNSVPIGKYRSYVTFCNLRI